MSDQTQPDSAESAKPDSSPKEAETAKSRSGKVSSAKISLKPDRRPLITAAVIALVAGAVGGVGVAALWHPSSGASSKFSGRQVADAKKDLCGAVLLTRQAVANNMHLKNPEPENPVAQLAVAANARLSLTAGAAYLRGRMEEDAAAPQDIVTTTREMAGALERLNLSYLVGQQNSDREKLGHDLDARITELGKLCQ